jgi:hypothetical protein
MLRSSLIDLFLPTHARRRRRFYLPLTERKQGGNHSVATVGCMSTADLHLHRRPELGVRPGESDPAAMLCRVLLLLLAALTVMAALGLAWWLV